MKASAPADVCARAAAGTACDADVVVEVGCGLLIAALGTEADGEGD